MKKRRLAPSLGTITPTTLGEFSQKAMHVYGTFVLMDRAVADVRDGLKPVQRRILWAMNALKKQGSGFKKSAKIVGDTMGNYHPHGDQAIYDALVNMTSDRYPLVEGHGNFGSPTDNAASMRYTEARLAPLAEELFKDVDIASLVPNYSGDRQEPLVLPSRLPLVLLNGSMGIGVGLRTSIPPHNLRELLKVLIYFITRDEPSLDVVVKHLPGPDYAYGGVLLSTPEEVKSLYAMGAGSLQFRCEYEFETTKSGNTLVVTSLCPGFSMSIFLRKMRELQESGLIEFCSDATSAKGIKIYVGFKDATVIKERVLPELHRSQSYQFYVVKRTTDDEAGIGEQNLFSGGLFRLFQEFLDFRRECENARLSRELNLAKAQRLKQRALLAAIQNLDKVFEVLQDPDLQDDEAVRLRLAEVLSLRESQAQVILDAKLISLRKLSEASQLQKLEETNSQIEAIKTDLSNIDGVIVRHLKELLKFSDDRRTRIGAEAPRLVVEESEKFVILQGMKATRQDKEPSRRHKFEFVMKGTSSVTVVLANNEAKTLPLSYLTEETFPQTPVGILGDSSTLLAAVDQQGKVVTITPPNRATFNVMRGAMELVSAVGLVPGSYLALTCPSGRGRLLHIDSLDASRAFVRGRKLFPNEEYGTSKDRVSKLFALGPGAELFDGRGRCLTAEGNEYFEGKQGFFCIGQQNFVLVKDDRRDIVGYDEAVTLLKNGALKECWIL